MTNTYEIKEWRTSRKYPEVIIVKDSPHKMHEGDIVRFVDHAKQHSVNFIILLHKNLVLIIFDIFEIL